ncbi:MAG: lipid kinase [Cyanobacteria bacterium P01_D01_bin.73]
MTRGTTQNAEKDSGGRSPRHGLLLVNPKSRRGAAALGPAIAQLEAQGLEITFRSSRNPEDLPDIIERHRDQVDCVIVGGGDGTLNAALPGLLGTQLPLGILPLGTANDLARTLGIPNDLTAACDLIAKGYQHRIDVGLANNHPFFNVASMGLSVDITQRLTRAAKKQWGVLAYLWSAMQTVLHSKPFRATIETEDGKTRVRTIQIAVGNGRFYGGGMAIASDATIDDERLDLYSLETRRWWDIVNLLPAIYSGQLREVNQARTMESRSFRVTTSRPHSVNTDGEISTTTPVLFELQPRAIAVFTPSPKDVVGLDPPPKPAV